MLFMQSICSIILLAVNDMHIEMKSVDQVLKLEVCNDKDDRRVEHFRILLSLINIFEVCELYQMSSNFSV